MEITQSRFMAMVEATAPALFKAGDGSMDEARQITIDRQRAAMEAAGFVIIDDPELVPPSVD